MEVLDECEFTDHTLFVNDDTGIAKFVPLMYKCELVRNSLGTLCTLTSRLWRPKDIADLQKAGFYTDDDSILEFLDKSSVVAIDDCRLLFANIQQRSYEAPDAALGPIDILLNQTKFPNLDTIVDLGTGNGKKFKHILDKIPHKQAIGFDFYLPEKKLADIEYAKADLDDQIPLENQSADMCLSVDGLSQICNPFNGVAEALRILKSKGYFLFVDRNMAGNYFTKNFERMGITILQKFEMPVRVEAHPRPVMQITSDTIKNTPELVLLSEEVRAEAVATIIEESTLAKPQTIQAYDLNYSCVLAQKK